MQFCLCPGPFLLPPESVAAETAVEVAPRKKVPLVPSTFRQAQSQTPEDTNSLTTRAKLLCQEGSQRGFNSCCNSWGKLEPDKNQKAACCHTYHFPFGLVVRSTQAKWNHSIGHCKTERENKTQKIRLAFHSCYFHFVCSNWTSTLPQISECSWCSERRKINDLKCLHLGCRSQSFLRRTPGDTSSR